jgi:hypothetical protein
MSGLRLKFSELSASFSVAIEGFAKPIAFAATDAVYIAGENVKKFGRANIASAGFSTRWQNTLRVNYYPPKGESINAAAFVFHKIPYAGVFDEPTTIVGKPMLWLALPTVKKLGRRMRTPKAFSSVGIRLFSVNSGSKRPLLVAKVRTNRDVSGGVSLGMILKGTSGIKGKVQSVPLFFGMTSVSQSKRFHIAKLAESERNKLPIYYSDSLKVD